MRSSPRLAVAAILTALVGALLTVTPLAGTGDQASAAANAADFDAGYLVSDELFYDGGAMTAAQVQSFIEAKQVGCLAEYTCLDTFTQSTPAKAADAYCEALPGRANEPAASIISRVGVACDISERALLVLLQKEQSLVTHRSPNATRYERATGYGCPDTTGCDPSVGGFFNQVYLAARAFTRYAALPQNYNHQVGVVNQVRYHPNAACGTGPVLIHNAATAGLYNYTPYQPNAAALGNLYGTGDSCSAYGNRNFWRFWTDWFGDPTPLPLSDRVAGGNRYETAVAISRGAFPTTAPVVYLASGQNFPDGLAAGPAAAHEGGPVLLTPRAEVPQSVLAEITRLNPAEIVIVGGEPSVSAEVETAVRNANPGRTVLRLGGDNRFQTSRLIAEHAFRSAPAAFIATGLKFPDALAAGPAAAHQSGPVLLVDGRQATPDGATLETLRGLGIRSTGVVGDNASVSDAYGSALRTAGFQVRRYAGPNRFATAVQLGTVFGDVPPVSTVYVASGSNFPDALAGAAAAGAQGAPLLLARPDCMPAVTRSGLRDFAPDRVLMLGGTPTLSAATADYRVCG